MALSDLQVYSQYTYTTLTEVLAQQVDLFNGAVDNGIVLKVDGKQGDFSDSVFWAATSGLVRRRNPYGDGTIAEKTLSQRVDTMVKLAAGTPPVRLDPAWFAWIKSSPEEAAAVMGQQLAKQILADQLNVAVGTVTVAMLNVGDPLVHDISGNTGADALPSPLALSNTAIKLGDRLSDITAWFMHSKSWNDLYGNALTNVERLFTYGSTNVIRDPQGRRYIMADVPALVDSSGSPTKFHTLGLTSGAVEIDLQDDYFDNWSTTNGNENIKQTYQAEWSYMVGVKGFAWDKKNGGKAPNDAALFTGTNWDQVVTSLKDGPGVLMVSR